MNDKEREIEIFYPRVQLKKIKLESKNDVQNFCDTFIVKKHLLPKYLNQLRYLKIKQEKREQKKPQKLRKGQNQKSFSECDWKEMIYSTKVRTLIHNDLNKYLHNYSIEDLKKVKKLEKVK